MNELKAIFKNSNTPQNYSATIIWHTLAVTVSGTIITVLVHTFI